MGPRKHPPLTGSEVAAILVALGFKKVRTQSSHEQYECPARDGYLRSIVTLDTNYREFDETRIKTMIRQSKRTREVFYGATKGTARKASVPHVKLTPTTDPE
jgi:predicted RNA binding protein YcfA (HicA-like mRNA interferase family)